MSKGNGKFVLGALLGAAAGAVAGILFAPKSGKETRKVIKEKTKEYADKSKEFAVKEKEAAGDAIKNISDNISKSVK